MQNKILKIACLLAAMAVILGAFAAHGLKAKLSEDQIQVFQTGVRYQFYHTFGIFVAAILMIHKESKWLKRAAWAFVTGIILFSGSLFLLSCRDWLGISNWNWLGPITPLGGLAFILGWVFMFFGIPDSKNP